MEGRTWARIMSILIICQGSLGIDLHNQDDCKAWATDGECIKNPRFMWVNCLESCYTYSDDDNSLCATWASHGECSLNPKYLQIHCPKSCNYAIGWNPFTRAMLTIENKDISVTLELEEACENEVAEASNIIQARLKSAISYGIYEGLSKHAPSEFLLTYGLAEAFMYALRLNGIVCDRENEVLMVEYMSLVNNMDGLMSYNADEMARISPVSFAIIGTLNEAIFRSSNEGNRVCAQSRGKSIMDIAKILNPSVPMLRQLMRDQPPLPPPLPLPGHGPGPTLDLEAANTLQGAESGLVSLSAGLGLGPSQSKSPPPHPHFVLSNGVRMPALGLGTWQLIDAECADSVFNAITMGYRHIDTAQAYGNEVDVGNAVARAISSGIVTREELFITTKLSFDGDTELIVRQQLLALQTSYIDLYLLHSPIQDEGKLRLVWGVLEKLHEAGLIRALGVSNHDSGEIQKLLSLPVRYKPQVVQNKFDIYHPGKQLDANGDAILHTCLQHDMLMVAYSPFSAYPFVMRPLEDPLVAKVAKSLGLTPATTLIRWALQQGVAIIPRTSNEKKLQQNLEAVTNYAPLPHEAMQVLCSISQLLSNRLSVAETF